MRKEHILPKLYLHFEIIRFMAGLLTYSFIRIAAPSRFRNGIMRYQQLLTAAGPYRNLTCFPILLFRGTVKHISFHYRRLYQKQKIMSTKIDKFFSIIDKKAAPKSFRSCFHGFYPS